MLFEIMRMDSLLEAGSRVLGSKMSQVWITVVHSKPTNLGMDVARKSSLS